MVVNLYTAIYNELVRDEVILSLMGLTGSGMVTRARRIQRRAKPQDLIIDNMPMIAFYAIPQGGLQARNDYVYDAVFVFDVYTHDDVSLAQDIAQRITDRFHGEISPFEDVENFESLLINQHESDSSLNNTYAFTTVIKFSLALEK